MNYFPLYPNAITLFLLMASWLVAEDSTPLPRHLLALYDGSSTTNVNEGMMHLYAETPLNHLGYALIYQDVNKGLPNLSERHDIAGVITWFPGGFQVKESAGYLKWAAASIDAGKRFVVVGNPGFYSTADTVELPLLMLNAFWEKLGLQDRGRTIANTYQTRIQLALPKIAGFERQYQGQLPAYRSLALLDDASGVIAHVTARDRGNSRSDAVLVATGPNGGYIAEDYGLYIGYLQGVEFKRWFINPFAFFRLAFDQSAIPKLDTTTHAGRRIYYSHIDGDGWNSLTQLESYRHKPVTCAEVIQREILEPNPDLPVTVAPIGADIDLTWVSTEKSREVARQILRMPQVEVGCHTFTHPFDWQFFEHYTPEKEAPYLSLYPDGSWNRPTILGMIKNAFMTLKEGHSKVPLNYSEEMMDDSYKIPRAYALKPFDINLEVKGAIDEINALTSSTKPVAAYQWSGNCLPFEKALRLVREAGISNLNGGSTRFDNEFSSYAYVYPLGRRLGEEQQIYASNSNENTYTDNWSGKYYGFNALPQTFANTETPLRLRPMNLYYHMYSGERLAGLNAIKTNLGYVRSQSTCPLAMSRFATIVEGFYNAKLITLGQTSWRVVNRGTLQTLRFDYATLLEVDFGKSKGVIGQRHLQGSLYVFLDASVEGPVVTLRSANRFWEEPAADFPQLISSSWDVRNYHRNGTAINFTTQGFGSGELQWRVADDGQYVVRVAGKEMLKAEAKQGILSFTLPPSLSPVEVEMTNRY